MDVKIEKLDHFGRGITKIDNKICFVENALPSEIVEIEIIMETKKYLLAVTKEVIKKSPDRIMPRCPYYYLCGGCNLDHLSFSKENQYKEEKVKEILKRFANISENKVKNIIYDKPYHYRNKIILHKSEDKIGLYTMKTNNLIPIKSCYLVNEKLNDEMKKIKNTKDNEIILRIGNKTGEILNSSMKIKKIISYIGNKKYQVSDKSFFQINNEITKKLYDEIKKIVIEKKSVNVLDLYCGTGTIGIYISDDVNEVLGIESCKEAISDANYNKELNNTKNCIYKLGKVENLTKEITKEYDTAIIDPPRNGLDKRVVEKLLEIKPKTLIYVSCDPVTLARDLNLLQQKYDIEYIQPYNMFPRTYHVECLSLLNLR